MLCVCSECVEGVECAVLIGIGSSHIGFALGCAKSLSRRNWPFHIPCVLRRNPVMRLDITTPPDHAFGHHVCTGDAQAHDLVRVQDIGQIERIPTTRKEFSTIYEPIL